MATFDLNSTISSLEQAAAGKKITADSVKMIRRWLTEPRYTEYAPEVAAQIASGKWKELDDAFWTVIPFGTGGRRGKMYPVGSNAINDRTIGESAQGVADYVREWTNNHPPLPMGEGRGEGAGNLAKPLLAAESLKFAQELRKNQTDAEDLLWGLLRERRLGGFKFRRQHPLGSYYLDFYCHEAKLAIELDGGQHNTDEGRQHDQHRTRRVADEGIRVIRFWNHDVLGDIDTVLEAIWSALHEGTLTPTLSPSERERAGTLTPALSPRKRELSCAIAYDTRHNSRHFAELCAEIMVAAGFKVYFLDGFRSTPELSFAVRHTNSACGIMVTASHNPPSDNAVKVYWAGGVQVLPPHDKAIIDRVMNVDEIRRTPFDKALAAGKVVYCQAEIDAAFINAVHAQSLLIPSPPRRGQGEGAGNSSIGPNRHPHPGPLPKGEGELKIIYSPLHGVGALAVLPALKADGFTDVELFGPHAEPNGDFPNVPGHVSNPENPAVFDIIIECAKQIVADLILASDPDCDRLGAAAAMALKAEGGIRKAEEGRGSESPLSAFRLPTWQPFTGNQIAALLADYVLSVQKRPECSLQSIMSSKHL